MTKLKSRYKHEQFRTFCVSRTDAGLYFERLSLKKHINFFKLRINEHVMITHFHDFSKTFMIYVFSRTFPKLRNYHFKIPWLFQVFHDRTNPEKCDHVWTTVSLLFPSCWCSWRRIFFLKYLLFIVQFIPQGQSLDQLFTVAADGRLHFLQSLGQLRHRQLTQPWGRRAERWGSGMRENSRFNECSLRDVGGCTLECWIIIHF